jgi:hypothetical protein
MAGHIACGALACAHVHIKSSGTEKAITAGKESTTLAAPNQRLRSSFVKIFINSFMLRSAHFGNRAPHASRLMTITKLYVLFVILEKGTKSLKISIEARTNEKKSVIRLRMKSRLVRFITFCPFF